MFAGALSGAKIQETVLKFFGWLSLTDGLKTLGQSALDLVWTGRRRRTDAFELGIALPIVALVAFLLFFPDIGAQEVLERTFCAGLIAVSATIGSKLGRKAAHTYIKTHADSIARTHGYYIPATLKNHAENDFAPISDDYYLVPQARLEKIAQYYFIEHPSDICQNIAEARTIIKAFLDLVLETIHAKDQPEALKQEAKEAFTQSIYENNHEEFIDFINKLDQYREKVQAVTASLRERVVATVPALSSNANQTLLENAETAIASTESLEALNSLGTRLFHALQEKRGLYWQRKSATTSHEPINETVIDISSEVEVPSRRGSSSTA